MTPASGVSNSLDSVSSHGSDLDRDCHSKLDGATAKIGLTEWCYVYITELVYQETAVPKAKTKITLLSLFLISNWLPNGEGRKERVFIEQSDISCVKTSNKQKPYLARKGT